jgi:hypothetical protein
MSSVRRIDNQEDPILKVIGNERRSKVTAIAIKDKHPLGISGFILSVSIKYILKPV